MPISSNTASTLRGPSFCYMASEQSTYTNYSKSRYKDEKMAIENTYNNNSFLQNDNFKLEELLSPPTYETSFISQNSLDETQYLPLEQFNKMNKNMKTFFDNRMRMQENKQSRSQISKSENTKAMRKVERGST